MNEHPLPSDYHTSALCANQFNTRMAEPKMVTRRKANQDRENNYHMTLEEIADALYAEEVKEWESNPKGPRPRKVTRERVRQIAASGLKKVRAYARFHGIRFEDAFG